MCVDPLNFNSGSSGTSLLGSEVLNRLFKCFLLSVSFGAVCNVSFADGTVYIILIDEKVSPLLKILSVDNLLMCTW